MTGRADRFRLDWRPEFAKLSPYLKGAGGVIGVEYDSENAAPELLNYFLKEDFGKPDDGKWLSLRIDREWFTTRKALGVIDEVERLLDGAGLPTQKDASSRPEKIVVVSDNDVQGDMYAHIENLTIGGFGDRDGRDLRVRLKATCHTLKRFVEQGGHFMIVMNDMPIGDQTEFWRQVWSMGLAEAGGSGLLLVVHAGHESGRKYHQDCPEIHERVVLPDSVETDEARCNDIYDDLFDIFESAGVENAGALANVHLESFKGSMLQLHLKLSANLMAAKATRHRGGI